MKGFKTNIIFLCIAAGIFLLTGCDAIIEPADLQNVNDTIRSMEYLDQEPELASPLVLEDNISADDPDHPDRPDDLPGFYNSVRKEKAATGFDENLLLNPTNDIIWIGSVFDGNSITSGEYRPVSAKRGPMTFSISIPMAQQWVTVPEATLNYVRQGITDIVTSEVLAGNPADTQLTQENVYSSDQVKIAAGVHFRGWGASLKSSFSFGTKNVRSRVLVKFLQIYYTLDMNLPDEPDDLFASGVTWRDIQSQIRGNVSPVYVSSVKYGRMGLLAVESDYSEEEVKVAFKMAYDAIVAGGGASLDIEYKNIISESTINVRIYGGSGESACQIFGYESFVDWIKKGGEFSKASPGAPLSYTLRYVRDNSVARVILASEYYVRNAVQIQNKFRIKVTGIENMSDGSGAGQTDANLFHLNSYAGYGEEDVTDNRIWNNPKMALPPRKPVPINASHEYEFDRERLEDAYIKLEFLLTLLNYSAVWGSRTLSIGQVIDDIAKNGFSGDNPDKCYYLYMDADLDGMPGFILSIFANFNLRISYLIEPIE
ncbi:MAG: thiol-activated cytolysin family protein [Spirochaetales bacterium]|nr:thiol-activated cytolysin family protein [Spirochaetales bacterium]